jgi:nucleoside phosphorylase
MARHMKPIAIITALDTVEFQAVQALSSEWRERLVPFDDTLYIETTFSDGDKKIAVVAAHAPRMGMASSAMFATKMIHNFRPRWLCMCGIAAGVRGKVNLGDILAADPSWDWGSGKQDVRNGKSHFSPAPNQIGIEPGIRTKLRRYARDESLLAKIRAGWPANKPDSALRLHVEPVASGAAVLADRTYVDFISDQQRKFVGAEMEVYGVYIAGENCAKPRPMTFALKSVCDFADEQKSDEFQAYAAYTSARFLHAFAIREFPSLQHDE